jgi:hypothetical protein
MMFECNLARAVAPLIATAAAIGVSVPAFAQPWGELPEGARDMSGIWSIISYNPRILPMDGSDIPFTEQGRQKYEENVAALRSGELEDHSRVWCSPDGLPRVWAQPYPFEITQTENQMVILYERNAVYRVIPIDVPIPDEFDLLPYFLGNSYGHWEDDSFVVRVMGFKTYTTFLDDTGVPSTFDLHITERFTKTDDDHLELIVTVEDPEIFTHPWDARYEFERRDDIAHLDFWVCGEEHRDVSDIEGVTP